MSLAIRRARLSDVPAILSLEQQAPMAAHWPAAEYARVVATQTILVAESEGELCGFVCAASVAGEWELENIVVANDYLRRGIADALLRGLLDHARRARVARVFLEVRESNLPARRLYEKHGFQKTGERRAYYQHPAEGAILYEWGTDSR